MKKIIVVVLVLSAGFMVFHKKMVSWVKINFVSREIPYYQQRHEFFKKLSKEYYGVESYGDELETINRTFNSTSLSTDRVALIIPGYDAINRLKQRRTVVAIDNKPYTKIVDRKMRSLVNSSASKSDIKKVEPIKSSTFVVVGGLILFSSVITLLGYFSYRRKKKDSASLRGPERESIISDDRILFDFDVSKYEEDRFEPNEIRLKKVA